MPGSSPTAGREPADGAATAWRADRREAAAHHAAALARTQARETARARELLADFIARAEAAGLPPQPLLARSRTGHGRRYRTGLTGWYLRENGSVGVTPTGDFYVLSTDVTALSRFRGVRLVPADPPLVLGKGGRDGESLDLADAIEFTLASPDRRVP